MDAVMNRREFFLAWLFRRRSSLIEVAVMEVFSTPDGPSTFLVHHATEVERNSFAEWLRSRNGTHVVCQSRNGVKIDGTIFRVRMCFGRGLILTGAPVSIRPKDVLIVN